MFSKGLDVERQKLYDVVAQASKNTMLPPANAKGIRVKANSERAKLVLGCAAFLSFFRSFLLFFRDLIFLPSC